MTDIKREDVETALAYARDRQRVESFAARHMCVVTIALCEQWIEARRARWLSDEGGEYMVVGGEWYGTVRRDGVARLGDAAPWCVDMDGGWQLFNTEAEARAHLESRAIADGYEIVREP